MAADSDLRSVACKEHGDIEDPATGSSETVVLASNYRSKRRLHGILANTMSPSPPIAHFIGAQGMWHELEVDSASPKKFSEDHGA